MVRLLPERLEAQLKEIRQVSIPQWCDCCQNPQKCQQNSVKRFNPTMVRLLHLDANFVTIDG